VRSAVMRSSRYCSTALAMERGIELAPNGWSRWRYSFRHSSSTRSVCPR